MAYRFPPPWFLEIGNEAAKGPYVFSCEHASNHFGTSEAQGSDRRLLAQHWAYDLGAAKLTGALVDQTDGIGVLSKYSRLLLDPNRTLESDSLFVLNIENQVVQCNQGLTAAERTYRIKCLHKGYHDGLSKVLRENKADRNLGLVSIHSFTPVWQNRRRAVEIGVLFDSNEETANMIVKHIQSRGYDCRANEPYSGLTGELMYAATHHGQLNQIPYLEFEVRQDLLGSEEAVSLIAGVIHDALDAHFLPLIRAQ